MESSTIKLVLMQVPKPSQYGMPYVEETLTTKDGVKIKSYIITLKDQQAAKNAPTIIYHHANAGNMGHRLPIAQVFYEKFKSNVVMLSYRGYGLSEGTPSDKGLRIDSQVSRSVLFSLVHRWIPSTDSI
jgi:abhydrolase domain-containing protein 13